MGLNQEMTFIKSIRSIKLKFNYVLYLKDVKLNRQEPALCWIHLTRTRMMHAHTLSQLYRPTVSCADMVNWPGSYCVVVHFQAIKSILLHYKFWNEWIKLVITVSKVGLKLGWTLLMVCISFYKPVATGWVVHYFSFQAFCCWIQIDDGNWRRMRLLKSSICEHMKGRIYGENTIVGTSGSSMLLCNECWMNNQFWISFFETEFKIFYKRYFMWQQVQTWLTKTLA